MKIITIVRTYNEERNLKKFVSSYYDWVDKILILDDFSDDVTYLMDVSDSKVIVEQKELPKIDIPKIERTKQDEQLNYLIDWAEHLKADWIIMDDCDSFPNKQLQQDGRELIHRANYYGSEFFYATRIYFYKDEGYFPRLSRPEGTWTHSLWAWKANQGFRFIDNGNNGQKFVIENRNKIFKVHIPDYWLEHYPWPNDEAIIEKRKRYTKIYGDEYKDFNPLNFGGDLKEIPKWLKENEETDQKS